jgi:hypothetical protein
MSEIFYLLGMMNGAEGISDIEHVAIGIARVDGNAARVAGVSTGSASDQGKVTRVGANERGQRIVSMEPPGGARNRWANR